MIKLSTALALIFLQGILYAQQAPRVWTDEQGRKIKAELIDVKENMAVLLMPNRRKIPYPIEKLSEIDQVFIKEFIAEAEKPEEEDLNNFSSPWPDRISFKDDPQIEVIKEDPETKEYIYHSAHYRYNCNVRLNTSVVRGFAALFETTHKFVRELPLSINGGVKTDGKYEIVLVETDEQYIQAGGIPGSAGVYFGSKNLVLVPLTNLGVRKVGRSYTLDRDKSSKTLPHELVHQLTPNRYFQYGARGWFSEGLAEYIAVTPYRSASYNVRSNARPIIKYVTAYGENNSGGKALGNEIRLGSLEEFMLLPYDSFLSKGSVNYGSALLITNFFFHMDREKDGARIKKFLKALQTGKKGQDALNVLLDGQTFLELEEEIAKAYSRSSIDFIFSEEN